MKEGWIIINGVPTHIFTWGQWIEDKFDDKIRDIVLLITGNPGLGGYYLTFCSTLYEELNNEVPVWLIGHAGRAESKIIM